MTRLASTAIGLVLICCGAQAQPAAPKFDVASVKADDLRGVMPSLNITAGGITVTHMFPRQIIAAAYGVPRDLISGGPAWLDSEAYDIQAKSAGPADPSQTKEMLQSLLADRFKLQVRRESKDLPISYMTMPKQSPKLVPGKDGERSAFSWGYGWVTMHNMSMEQLAAALRRSVGHTVIDKTGLQGSFDVQVDNLPPDSAPKSEDVPLLVMQGLGLKLESIKGPTDTILIESVERPGEN